MKTLFTAEVAMADKIAAPGQLSAEPKINGNGVTAKGYVQDIESFARKNDDFRRVLYTTKIASSPGSFSPKR